MKYLKFFEEFDVDKLVDDSIEQENLLFNINKAIIDNNLPYIIELKSPKGTFQYKIGDDNKEAYDVVEIVSSKNGSTYFDYHISTFTNENVIRDMKNSLKECENYLCDDNVKDNYKELATHILNELEK